MRRLSTTLCLTPSLPTHEILLVHQDEYRQRPGDGHDHSRGQVDHEVDETDIVLERIADDDILQEEGFGE